MRFFKKEIIIVLGLIFFLMSIYCVVKKNNKSLINVPAQNDIVSFVENVVNFPEKKQISYGLPTRLKIPKINVDAVVEYVGVTSEGAMDVPKEPADVAWFNLGPRPGEIGNAVMSGHYGWKNNILAVFDNLQELQKGDKIYIEDEKGLLITFIVRESKNYEPEADALDVFDSKDGKSHLNLITCGGTWNKNIKSYSQRLVVFADKIVE